MADRKTRAVRFRAEHAKYIATLVAFDAYGSHSEMVCAALPASQVRDAAIDRYLREEVMSVYDSVPHDPDRVITGGNLAAVIESCHTDRLKSAKQDRQTKGQR